MIIILSIISNIFLEKVGTLIWNLHELFWILGEKKECRVQWIPCVHAGKELEKIISNTCRQTHSVCEITLVKKNSCIKNI